MSFAIIWSLSAVMATTQPLEFTILHTNDWQSRFLGFGPNSEYSPESINDDQTTGGIARLATLLNQRKEAAEKRGPVLVLDGGDWTMGTLFHTITRETGAELQLLKRLGYDAVAIGNHEFDFRPQGLARMIRAAGREVGELMPILSANMVFSPEHSEDDGLEALATEGVVKPYVVIEKGGLRFGVLGLMGIDAKEVSPAMWPVTFEEPIASSQKVIKQLLETEDVDVIIAASHCGVLRNEDGQWYGEEVDLVKAVPEIDVVVGGHSHTALKEPISRNGAVIVQAGADSRFLGELRMQYSKAGLKLLSYNLHPIDDSIPGDPIITAEIERFKSIVTDKVLEAKHFDFDQALVEVEQDFGRSYDQYVLGNLVTDAIRRATGAEIAFTGNGTIRDELHRGQSGIQRVSDVFRTAPLGIGVHDDEPGYPLAKVYFTAAELKSILEIVSFAYSLKGPSYFPRLSGIRFRYNAYRVPFDRVMEIELGSHKHGYHAIDVTERNSKLYSIGVSTYVGGFFSIVQGLSRGLLSVVPKDAQGKPILDINAAIVDGDPAEPGVQEIKEWQAVLEFVRLFPDTDRDGIPNIDSNAVTNEERMIVVRSLAPKALAQNATYLMGISVALGLLAVGILVGIAVLVIRRLRLS